MRRGALRAVLVAALVLPLAACGSGAPADPPATVPVPEQRTLGVFAAASLRDVFTRVGDGFANEHPGVDVRFNFAGSSDLAAQLAAGAPADVFASADVANMQKATGNGNVDGVPVDFATNTLTIVTPPSNPAGIGAFADLARPGVDLVVCAPQVPCGSATGKLAQLLGVTLAPVSEENSVADVLGKVTSGQADAGIVYRTDAALAGSKLTEVTIADASRIVNVYPIAVVASSGQRDLARDFVDYVTSPAGRRALAEAGFGAP